MRFWYSKGMGFLGAGYLLFGLAQDINHNKQVEQKLKQMAKEGLCIKFSDKKIYADETIKYLNKK